MIVMKKNKTKKVKRFHNLNRVRFFSERRCSNARMYKFLFLLLLKTISMYLNYYYIDFMVPVL